MNSNCYDKTIAALVEKGSKLRSAEHISVIEKAIESLEEKRNTSSIEDELNGNKLFSSENHAPVVLSKIHATDRQPSNMMKVITQEFFETVKTPDGQKFEKMGSEDVYSLNAKSGTYLFTVVYISEFNKHYINFIREQSTSNRESHGEMYIFNRLPRFVSNENDVKIIERNFMKMLKKLSRGWKYLKSNTSPSTSSSAGPSTNSISEPDDALKDPYEVVTDYLNNVAQ